METLKTGMKFLIAVCFIAGLVGCYGGVVWPEEAVEGERLCKENGGLKKWEMSWANAIYHCKDGMKTGKVERKIAD